MNNLRQHPTKIIQRYLAIDILRELGAEEVNKLNSNLVKSYVEENESGEEIECFELDWEYLLFDAPDYQIETAFKKLEESNPEKVSSLLDSNGKKMTYTKPGK